MEKSSSLKKLPGRYTQIDYTPKVESKKQLQSDFVVPNVMIKIQQCEKEGSTAKTVKKSQKGSFVARKKSVQEKIIELQNRVKNHG